MAHFWRETGHLFAVRGKMVALVADTADIRVENLVSVALKLMVGALRSAFSAKLLPRGIVVIATIFPF